MQSIYKVSLDKIKSVNWEGDPIQYDLELFKLGEGSDEFLVVNPNLLVNLDKVITKTPPTRRCIVWKCANQWVAKKFTKSWDPKFGYYDIEVPASKLELSSVWQKNTDLDPLMTFEDDPYEKYIPTLTDYFYELVWYIDERFNPSEDKVWVRKYSPTNGKSLGIKEMGFLTPKVRIEANSEFEDLNIDIDTLCPPYYHLHHECIWRLDQKHDPYGEHWVVKFFPEYRDAESSIYLGSCSPNLEILFNPALPKLNYEFDYDIPWWDLKYEHVWTLDSSHCKNAPESLWAFTVLATSNPQGTKFIGSASPNIIIEKNPELPKLEYDIDYDIQYHDFNYEHMWMLDEKHCVNSVEPIWAVKAKMVKFPKGAKIIGDVSPGYNIEYNPELPNLNHDIKYDIQHHDFEYEHVWYMDKKYTLGKKVWAAKMSVFANTVGEKDMGTITPVLPDLLDVIFISYNEPNAEKNWKRVLEKAPWAKRVDGIEGILEAHKAAAKLSTSDMFYVVDGDAYLVDDWSFDFQPSLFDRDCAYVWSSQNPVNGLVYGYGGVKLFSKKLMLKTKKWKTLDMTTTVMPKLKVMDKISNITAFNTDEFSTWRSSFRECVKLSLLEKEDPTNLDHKKRLDKWLTSLPKVRYGKYAINGAIQAVKYTKEVDYNLKSLIKINDLDWLKSKFKSLNKGI